MSKGKNDNSQFGNDETFKILKKLVKENSKRRNKKRINMTLTRRKIKSPILVYETLI